VKPSTVEQRGGKPTVRLVVLHHAGGSSATYHPLARALPAWWDVVLFDLPGRGRRHAQPPLREMSQVVDLVTDELVGYARQQPHVPCALFGHSMGAVVAAEVARRLTERYQPPVWVGVSGRPAPLAYQPTVRWSELSDADLAAVLMSLGGTPERLLREPALYRRFLDVARADLRALDSYLVDPDRTLLSCPLTAFGGLVDPSAPPHSLPAWEQETTGPYRQCFLPGGHFYFLQSGFAALAREVRWELGSALKRARSLGEIITE
jgi:surfactin synthase thioesterase subunit